MRRRFLKCLQESIEGTRGEHMHLIDDVYPILPCRRGDVDLIDEVADVVDGVVGGRVELKDIVRPLLIGSDALAALIARLSLRRAVLAVDGLGKDAGARGLAHTPWTAEEVGVAELILLDRIEERGGQRLLPHHVSEGGGAVLQCRYDKVTHRRLQGGGVKVDWQ